MRRNDFQLWTVCVSATSFDLFSLSIVFFWARIEVLPVFQYTHYRLWYNSTYFWSYPKIR